MRTWLLTNTTYGTWLPGNARGSVTSVRESEFAVRIEHDIPGEPYEDEIPELEASARNQMSGPPVSLNQVQAAVAREQFKQTADYRRWRLRAVSVMHNHFHMVVEVDDDPHPRKLLADFKAYGTRALTAKFGKPASETWWTGKGSKRKLKDAQAVADAIYYVLMKQPNPLARYADPPAWVMVIERQKRERAGEPGFGEPGA